VRFRLVRGREGSSLWPRRDVLTADGVHQVEVACLAEQVVISLHWQAVAWFFLTRNEQDLRALDGMAVAGHTLVTDPNVLLTNWSLPDATRGVS
jgi:hypothetical protein